MEQLHKDIVDLQRKWHDRLDDAGHSLARQVSSAIQRLEDDIQVKKNPRTIEDQVKRIIQQLDNLEDGIMGGHHVDELQQNFERMRVSIQKLS